MVYLHVMIIDLQYVRDLSECLSQIRLVKMAGVIMEICVGNILFVPGGPRCTLAIILTTHCQPLLQKRNFLPQSVSVYLITKSKLNVKSTALDVLLQDIFPHESDASKLRTLTHICVQCEIVAGMCYESPIRLKATSNQEFVASATQMRCDRIRPFVTRTFTHLQINVVPVKGPPLVCEYWIGLQLAGIW